MPDIPEGHVVHLTRRRLRIKVPDKRHDRAFFSDMRQHLSQRPGLQRIEVNPATASILIHSSDSRAFLNTLGRDGPFKIIEPLSEEQAPLVEQVRQQLMEWDRQMQRWTGSRHDARAYIFMALVLSAGYQTIRGDIFAPAATLLWYAGEALRLWGPVDKTSGRAAEDTV